MLAQLSSNLIQYYSPYGATVWLQTLKGMNTAVQLGSLVRFVYDSNTSNAKRGASMAASGKAFDY